jgi:hypothetical protein
MVRRWSGTSSSGIIAHRKGELAESGDWVVANISTNSFWPIASQKVRWRGVDIWIMPIMKGFYPAVAVKVPPGTPAVSAR